MSITFHNSGKPTLPLCITTGCLPVSTSPVTTYIASDQTFSFEGLFTFPKANRVLATGRAKHHNDKWILHFMILQKILSVMVLCHDKRQHLHQTSGLDLFGMTLNRTRFIAWAYYHTMFRMPENSPGSDHHLFLGMCKKDNASSNVCSFLLSYPLVHYSFSLGSHSQIKWSMRLS